MIFVFDLEGPLSPMDHAAEAMRVIGKKLGRPDFFEFFQMLSLYDDELTIEGWPDYNPGDTLRLIAPIISSNLTDQEMVAISETATLTPGAADLIATLDKADVYVASTSYHQHAHMIAKKLGLRKGNVNCTELPRFKEFPYLEDLLRVFERYKKADIKKVKRDLDRIFWAFMEPDYLKTQVCGGQAKLDVVERVSKEKGVKIREVMAVGDSITDMNMLEGVANGRGLAVSFNGNQYSVPKANLAVSSLSLMALKPLVDAYPKTLEFVKKWNSSKEKLNLLKPETRAYFAAHKLKPYYDEVRMSDLDEVVKRQKEMRMAMRKEYGELS